jgi:DNA-binding transcriptional MocR family regulator
VNSGATSERVYDALKRRIMTNAFRPGDRLDPSVLAETLASSVTPVRDALHLLTGEGLVETRTSDGFHLPQVDAPALQDLYAWNAGVLGLALGSARRKVAAGDGAGLPGPAGDDIADLTARVFSTIALRSDNFELRRAIGSANDRLHAVRRSETAVLEAVDDEIDALHEVVRRGTAVDLRKAIVGYHRRRHRFAAEIARSLYRDADTR